MHMTVLIASRDGELAQRWQAELQTDGLDVIWTDTCDHAQHIILSIHVSLAILDLEDASLAPLVLADLLAYRHPDVSILPITSGRLFADGSIHTIMPNVRFVVTPAMATADIRAAVDYCLHPSPLSATA
jgi:DNA-binding NtrC family response regulator